MAPDPHDVTGELITRSLEGPVFPDDPLRAAWVAAEAEAVRAYDEWCERRSADAFEAYRAAAARADAAQDALSSRSVSRPSRITSRP